MNSYTYTLYAYTHTHARIVCSCFYSSRSVQSIGHFFTQPFTHTEFTWTGEVADAGPCGPRASFDPQTEDFPCQRPRKPTRSHDARARTPRMRQNRRLHEKAINECRRTNRAPQAILVRLTMGLPSLTKMATRHPVARIAAGGSWWRASRRSRRSSGDARRRRRPSSN